MSKNISAEQLEDAARLRAIFEGRKREDRSWTQERLAQECGWKTQSAAQQYLNGLVPLNLDALIKFSLALDVPVTDISPSLGAKILAVRTSPSLAISISPQAQAVATAFDKLDTPAKKAAVIAQLEAFNVL
ncbi:helix-turn-helix transcriptional regulator [Herbaspirillum huttiense]|uniref:helix-turn-helix domain-containing protein n=1 Tax=Herbaspirillum huttiense TaxID=863372 RepID=UPI002E79320A|nr:helix-turn-helix transcriptional regulator [Herbaspirillum huttiense]MEE1637180.1 helix-turn-helix transcriptional regulator [Herbaspirillum huttiense NC40101]